MLLGHVLERLGDEAFAAETLVGMGDLPLMVEAGSTGDRFGESLPAYAVGATRRFAAFASDEDWLALMNALERARDPGAACLHHMLTWSLARDREEGGRACGCGADCQGSAE
jgi:hypothetical protein